MLLEALLVLILVLAGAFVFGTHVAVALGFVGIILLTFFSDRPTLGLMGHSAWELFSDTTLIVIPLFALMGDLLVRSGVTDSMYRTMAMWMGRVPGGLLHTNVIASAMFGSVSGTSVAVASTIGSVAIPQLYEKGYPRPMVLGSLAAGGTLGIMIPPSMVLVIYGMIAKESIGDLLMAGIVPGIMLTLLFMLVALYFGIRRSDLPRGESVPVGEKIRASLSLVPFIALMLIVVLSIYLGIATVTESAAFGVAGAFVLALLKKRVNWSMLKETFASTAATTAMIMFLLLGANIMQTALGYLGVQRAAGEALVAANLSPFMLMLIIVIVMLIAGAFLDSLAVIVTTLPIIVPLVAAAGFDMIWFGVIVVLLVEVGMITPPYGMNLFVLHGVQKKLYPDAKLGDAYRGSWPFVFAMIVGLVLLWAFPDLATWLPYSASSS
ncbi:TRAP transporter large permease [Microbacterium lushaniae]|uniref:TRAP transporter large permease subunit n=1 Tax=Microbacterium lushaniae TaxID=2614639 RepID=A0A5J6L4E6_9MICO|nr:TRAP transporter large permease subunit [Microbacterium lushaniae]QEW03290.1 TRAP transporter large permease subunit [Microbacterium lushaniae]